MNPPTEPCDGYWMNVNARQGAVPEAYRCLTQTEYDARMAEYARQDKQGGMFVLILLPAIISFVVLISFIASWYEKRRT